MCAPLLGRYLHFGASAGCLIRRWPQVQNSGERTQNPGGIDGFSVECRWETVHYHHQTAKRRARARSKTL